MPASHKLDISGLLSGGRQVMLVDDEIPIETFEGIAFPAPASVHVELRHVDRLLQIEGSVDVRAVGTCDACLDDVSRDVHVDVEERLDPFLDADDDPFGDGNVMSGSRLDLADLVQQLVLSVMPMGLRCADDCKGLCGVCGQNKNVGSCACATTEDDLGVTIRGKSQMEDASQ